MRSQLKRLANQNPDLFFKSAMGILSEQIQNETDKAKVSLFILATTGLVEAAEKREFNLMIEEMNK